MAVAGQPHLLTQHAVHGQALAIDEEDHAAYIEVLRTLSRDHRVQIHAYAVLPQEVLLLATPQEGEELGRLMQSIGRRYVASFNRRHARRGGLWDGRYRASVLDAREWMLPALLYIDQAAVRSGEAARSVDFPWASAAHYHGRRSDPVVTPPHAYWALGNTPFDREAKYRELDERGLTSAQMSAIQAALRGGWVLGGEVFQHRMAELLPGRPTTPRARGRPRKVSAPK